MGLEWSESVCVCVYIEIRGVRLGPRGVVFCVLTLIKFEFLCMLFLFVFIIIFFNIWFFRLRITICIYTLNFLKIVVLANHSSWNFSLPHLFIYFLLNNNNIKKKKFGCM